MALYTKEKNQETILAIVLGLLVIWYFFQFTTLIYISIALIVIALFIQSLASYITWFWMKLSHVMGWVMSKVILSVVFFLILFPIAMLARLFTKDHLMLKKEGRSSHYKERNVTYSKEDLENPW
jgi:uncharacterized membrane protein YcgQ (UPF0703/DUF1980 family)